MANGYLQKRNETAKAYRRAGMDHGAQTMADAAILTARDMFGCGETRAGRFVDSINKWGSEIMKTCNQCMEDRDEDLGYVSEKVDEALRQRLPEEIFEAWSVRYAPKIYEKTNDLEKIKVQAWCQGFHIGRQIIEDASILAVHEVFGAGPERAGKFLTKERERRRTVEIIFTQTKARKFQKELHMKREEMDQELHAFMGKHFYPWKERYPWL